MSDYQKKIGCYDCGRPYGDEHGFPDLIIPNYIWRRISPTGDDGGLLCPSCICKRLYDAGIKNVEAAFMSGPIQSVSQATMYALRRVENLEEKFLAERRAEWGAVVYRLAQNLPEREYRSEKL